MFQGVTKNEGEFYGVWLQVRMVRFKRAIAKDVGV